MLIEIHMIQNHSPSNLNRDDLGAPKTCIFGGVTRARISSQCLKRSIRNPGNADDLHNREPSLFAAAMAGHMGTKTKLFPWLVREMLQQQEQLGIAAELRIPEADHERIELAAKRIGLSKEKDEKTSVSARMDPRPKTAQLIHLGPRHAELFVQKLATLRNEDGKCYQYFLNPKASFEELVGNELKLNDSGPDEKIQKRIVKASWLVAKCRMKTLLTPDGEDEDEPALVGEQPGEEHARRIAEKLSELFADEKANKDILRRLVSAATDDEKKQIRDDAPDRPGAMDKFLAALKDVHKFDAVDIALFGRMTTSDAFEDVEAAMQVAHAISTHATINEVDYFTAVDDKGAGVGAGHVGEAMFNSPCFYKYFCLDWDQLVTNLAGPPPDARKDKEEFDKWKTEAKSAAEKLAAAALGHFIRAAALTTPSGKQNSFAANNEPCGILVEIKKKGKVATSYANAFAEPVERIGKPDDDAADEKSIEGRSVACLADHVQSVGNAYGIASTLFWYSPKLWRFPLQYWDRAADGKRKSAKLVTQSRFDVLGGAEGMPAGLVEAVVKEASGLDWADVRDVGKTPARVARP